MNEHKKKMIAPIIITVIFLLYYVGFTLLCIFLPETPLLFKILVGVLPLGFGGVIIYSLVTRIKEIRSGEEDDLSKY